MQEELEPNYEIQVFEKDTHHFMDSYFIYSSYTSVRFFSHHIPHILHRTPHFVVIAWIIRLYI